MSLDNVDLDKDQNAVGILAAPRDGDNAEVALLRQWLNWWHHDDNAPAKLPEALHVRTVMYLVQHDHKAAPEEAHH